MKRIPERVRGALLAPLAAALVLTAAAARAEGPRTAIGVDTQEPRHVVFWEGGRGLFGSRDGGETWTKLPASPRVVTRIVVTKGGSSILLGTDDGILRSEDAGRSFTAADAGAGSLVVVDLAAAGPAVFAVAEYAVLASRDGGRTFRNAGVPGRAFHLYRVRTNPRRPAEIVLISPSLLFLSEDGGETWTRRPAGADFDYGSVAWGVGEPPVVVSAGRLGIYRSTDDGQTWKSLGGSPPFLRGLWVPDPSTEKYLVVAVLPQPGDEALGSTGAVRGLYRTLDGGKTWSRNLTPDGGGVTDVAFAPGHLDVLYAVTESGGLFRSANKGESWRSVTPAPRQ